MFLSVICVNFNFVYGFVSVSVYSFQSLYHGDFVPLSVAALDLMRSDGLPLCSFALPMAMVCYMVLMSKHFAKQLVPRDLRMLPGPYAMNISDRNSS